MLQSAPQAAFARPGRGLPRRDAALAREVAFLLLLGGVSIAKLEAGAWLWPALGAAYLTAAGFVLWTARKRDRTGA